MKYFPYDYQEYAAKWILDKEKAALFLDMGERVIIVTGCINALVSRVSETFIKNLHLVFL